MAAVDMISLEASLSLYAQQVAPLPPVRRALGDALGHVLASEVRSRVDLPLFTQSAVDGYALRSADAAQAPATLRVIGDIAAGARSDLEVPPGCTVRIFTGGALPRGADTCVRQEVVERDGQSIRLQRPLRSGADTRFRGEEVGAGDVLAEAGQRLHSGMVASLAMAGVREVDVRPRPRVALIVTGDEVAGDAPQPGEIFDANGPLVRTWLGECGYPVASVAHVRDEPDRLRAAMADALELADIVLTTGGVSVGDHDHVPQVARGLGVREVFWKVAQKPGKPLWFGVTPQGKPMLGCPGNPAAVLIGLHVHARRLLGVLEGLASDAPAWRHGVLAQAVRADPQRDQLVRVRADSREDGTTVLTPLPRQHSHMLSNLAAAGGLAWIRHDAPSVDAGAVVRWLQM